MFGQSGCVTFKYRKVLFGKRISADTICFLVYRNGRSTCHDDQVALDLFRRKGHVNLRVDLGVGIHQVHSEPE